MEQLIFDEERPGPARRAASAVRRAGAPPLAPELRRAAPRNCPRSRTCAPSGTSRASRSSTSAWTRISIRSGPARWKLQRGGRDGGAPWPEFAGLHPLAPAADAAGYLELIGDLEAWLCAITGYDACSLQPNAGSQGELAGLLAIRGYHQSRREGERDVCLIPESAHGTNAASAVLAGLRVAVVKCGADGATSTPCGKHWRCTTAGSRRSW